MSRACPDHCAGSSRLHQNHENQQVRISSLVHFHYPHEFYANLKRVRFFMSFHDSHPNFFSVFFFANSIFTIDTRYLLYAFFCHADCLAGRSAVFHLLRLFFATALTGLHIRFFELALHAECSISGFTIFSVLVDQTCAVARERKTHALIII